MAWVLVGPVVRELRLEHFSENLSAET